MRCGCMMLRLVVRMTRSMLMMEMMKGMRTKRMVRMTRAVTPAMTPNMSLGGIEWGGTSEGFLLNPKT